MPTITTATIVWKRILPSAGIVEAITPHSTMENAKVLEIAPGKPLIRAATMQAAKPANNAMLTPWVANAANGPEKTISPTEIW